MKLSRTAPQAFLLEFESEEELRAEERANALIHNPKLPVPFALRLLPTLPDGEVRAIAKGAATSMPLKQAALERLQGGA